MADKGIDELVEDDARVHVASFDDPLGRDIDPDKLMAEGWVYRDVPWCPPNFWTDLEITLGNEDFILLAFSVRPSGDKRGQILISPAGLDKLRAYAIGEPKTADV